MKNTIESAVAAIFANYEEAPQLKDFQEEITMNLMERVRDLMKKGAGEKEAVGKALAELGDITGIADSIGRQKRKEAIGDYYFHKKPLDRKHAGGYCLAGVVLALGLIAAFLFGYNNGAVGNTLLVFSPFGLVSVCAFVFLALTQETRAHYPMTGRRSALFSAAAGLLFAGAMLGGALLFRDMYFSELLINDLAQFKAERISSMAVPSLILVFGLIISGIALLLYLALTQEKRLKPWVLEQYRQDGEKYGEKFGMLSAFIWTFAIALFVLLGFLIGWHPAWIVFLFAVAAETLALFFSAGKKGD